MIAIYVGFTQTVAVVLGPILGGVITQHSTSSSWKWIFWLNLPVGGLALAIFLVFWPRQPSQHKLPVLQQVRSIDFLGASLLLVASVLLIYALQQAGTRHVRWDSASVIASLAVASSAFVVFVLWEILIDQHSEWRLVEIFPVKVLRDRVMSAAIIVTILTSLVWYQTLVDLPDRYQIVHGDGPVKAGLRLLPMLVTSALGIFITGGLSSKANRTAYTTIAASGFQIVGYGLMTTIKETTAGLGRTYGFQVLLGLGFGMSITSTTMMVIVRYYSRPQFMSVAQGSITMMRMLGGALGLAIATIVFNDKIQGSAELMSVLSPAQIAHLSSRHW
ncbi:hypothetical protein LTR86_004205 [Recurvomyces mirabilis]|nr:hypothetical protein LTR86_004205 [Recurvomyces mirabilis]